MKILNSIALFVFLSISTSLFTGCDDIVPSWGGAREASYDSGSPSDNSDGGDNQNDTTLQNNKDSLNTITLAEQNKELSSKISEQDSILGGAKSDISTLKSSVDDLKQQNSRMISSSTVYALMLVEFILFSLFFYFFYNKLNNRTNKLKHTLKSSGQNGLGLQQDQVNFQIKQAIEDLARQINAKNRDQDNKIASIDSRLIKFENGLGNSSSNYSQGYGNVTAQENVRKPAQDDNPKIFFMPRTMKYGEFDDSKKKSHRDETTYFKFTLKKKNVAEFEFDPFDETCIKKAYDDKENSLTTVCEIDVVNTPPSTYRNKEKGVAELTNGIWKVTNKLKLQYV